MTYTVWAGNRGVKGSIPTRWAESVEWDTLEAAEAAARELDSSRAALYGPHFVLPLIDVLAANAADDARWANELERQAADQPRDTSSEPKLESETI